MTCSRTASHDQRCCLSILQTNLTDKDNISSLNRHTGEESIQESGNLINTLMHGTN